MKKIRVRIGNQKGQKGQSFLELALSLVFLLILLSAVIDLGWAFFTLIALRDSAQEAATAAAICPVATSGSTSFSRVLTRFKLSATAPINMNDLNNDQISVRIFRINGATVTDLCSYTTAHPTQCTGTPDVGDSVEVKVTYMHQIVTPLVGAFIGSQSYPLDVSAVDTLLASDCRIGQ